jgi:hypothetical protein
MKQILSILILLLSASAALANPFGNYVVIVPVNPGTLLGANGTQWVTSLWVSNGSDRDTTIDCDAQPCPVLKAHSTLQLPGAPYAGLQHNGFVLKINSGFLPFAVPSDAISVELRTTDSSTAPHSAGTEIPVARPSDFKKTALTLPHVPLNGHSRALLRLYGLTNGTATVRVIGLTTNSTLVETTVSLAGANPAAPATPPSYAELSLPASAAADDAVRIEVVPSSDLAVWGFVSVTDNVSEQFTIISPTAGFDYVAVSLL